MELQRDCEIPDDRERGKGRTDSKELGRERNRGGGKYAVMTYDEFSRDPSALAPKFDVVTSNFALLAQNISTLLRTALNTLAPSGAVIIQTVHPFVAADGRYEEGWRTADFARMRRPFPAEMPWYFRTMGSWLRELRDAGLQVVSLSEPVDPRTDQLLSLVLDARIVSRDGSVDAEGAPRSTDTGRGFAAASRGGWMCSASVARRTRRIRSAVRPLLRPRYGERTAVTHFLVLWRREASGELRMFLDYYH